LTQYDLVEIHEEHDNFHHYPSSFRKYALFEDASQLRSAVATDIHEDLERRNSPVEPRTRLVQPGAVRDADSSVGIDTLAVVAVNEMDSDDVGIAARCKAGEGARKALLMDAVRNSREYHAVASNSW
jgi:hypothetical protein